MHKSNLKYLVTLILLLVGTLRTPVYAQGPVGGEAGQGELPAENSQSAEDPAAGSPVELQQPDQGEPEDESTQADEVTTPDGGLSLSFIDLGFETVLVPRSGNESFTINLPANFVFAAEGSYLELRIGHFPPLPDKPSSMRVLFNNQPLAIIRLDKDNAEPTSYRLALSGVASPQPGINKISIDLDTGRACGVPGAVVDALIYEDSVMHLEFDEVAIEPDLSTYPFPFFENSYQGQAAYFVLPQQPTAVELSAAATVAAGLGKFSRGTAPVVAVTENSLTEDIRAQHHLLAIGRPDRNGLLAQLDLPLDLDSPRIGRDDGVLQVMVSPWNPFKLVLTASGANDTALLKASRALNRESHFLGLRGQVGIVKVIEPPLDPETPPNDIDLSLASLGYTTETFFGLNPLIQRYEFSMPVGWSMTAEPTFVLSFRHSELINPETSAVSVSLNKTPLGSALLDEENSRNGVLEVQLPPWELRAGRNEIRVALEMNLRGDADKCLNLDDQQAWTTIFNNSYLHLPFTPAEVDPHLGLFPFPFNQESNLANVLLVVPDHPQPQDLTAMLRLAVALGNATRGERLALEVLTAGGLDQVQTEDKHIITFGLPKTNTLIRALNDWLPQPFERGTNVLRPILDSVVVAPDPELSAGLLQELAIPWNLERTGLVLTGTDEQGVVLAYEALLHRAGDLSGDIAVTTSLTGTIHKRDTRGASPTAAVPFASRRSYNPERLVQLGTKWW